MLHSQTNPTCSRDKTSNKTIMTMNATFNECKSNLYSNDHTLIQKAAQSIRNMLSIEGNPPPFIRSVIQAGLVPRLVSLLEIQFDEYPVIQYEAAWGLTNIVAGTSEETRAVVDCNSCTHLIRLLSSTSEKVREQCAWVLRNILGNSLDGQEYATHALSIGCLPALLAILNNAPRVSTIRHTIGAIMNLLKARPTPSVENMQLALPYLAKTILLSVQDAAYDVKALSFACWALSYICDDAINGIQLLLDNNDVVPKLIELLDSEHYSVQVPALKSIGNIVLGNHAQTQAAINLSILPELTRLLLHDSKYIRKKVCWTLSNITAGSVSQIQAVLDCNYAIPRLIGALKLRPSSSSSSSSTSSNDDAISVQKEACFAIVNVFAKGTVDQILQIVTAGAIAPICAMLAVANDFAIELALEGLKNILNAAKKHGEAANDDDNNNNNNNNNNNKTLTQLVESFPIVGGILTIISLEKHKVLRISLLAEYINEKYFRNNRLLIDYLLKSDFSIDKGHSIASIRHNMKHAVGSGLRSFMMASEHGNAPGVDFLISNIIQEDEPAMSSKQFQVDATWPGVKNHLSSYSSNGIEGAPNYCCSTGAGTGAGSTKLIEQRTNFLKVLLPAEYIYDYVVVSGLR